MSVETFYRLDALIARADHLLDEIDTVSLDIFDTLFIRRIYDPDLIKFPVARYIAKRAGAVDLPVSRRQAWRARWDVERAHRKRHGESYPDHEACYPQYMLEALEQLFGDRLPADMLQQVTDYELLLENAMLVPRAPLVRWIERLYAAGKRVFLVSDIYLPAEHLKRLVAAKGLDRRVEDVISSADSFRAKASGAAFPLIEQRYGLDKRTWLHVGDNPISDGLRPVEFGIRALVIKDAGERQRKGIARAVHLNARRNAFWKGRNAQQLMLPLEQENSEKHPLYADGYHFFGTVLGNFIHGIAAQCQIQKIRRIYFCSREGWTFKKIWEASLPYFFPDGDAPEASYLYVSRMALAPAACATDGLAQLDTTVALLPAGNRDIRDICRVFGLDIEGLRDALDQAGLKDDDPIGSLTPGSTPELRRRFGFLLENQAFQNEVKRQTRPVRDALERYLESEGFFDHDEVALVDIGWLGTIQHYLIKSIEHRDDSPRVHGFLLGATRHIPYSGNFPNFEQYTSGILFDNNRFEFARSLVANVKDVFEEVCRAPQPDADGLSSDGGGIRSRIPRHRGCRGGCGRSPEPPFRAHAAGNTRCGRALCRRRHHPRIRSRRAGAVDQLPALEPARLPACGRSRPYPPPLSPG